ncbi:MAG: transglutaminase domain-containing protein, partial [Thermoanaerobaculia bacterium]
STGKSWQEIARRYSEIVDAQISAGKPRATDVVGSTTNRAEIINRALAYIQKNVRYAGVEVGESSIVPRTPQVVVGNRYGDCKDKATLLVALLRAAGVNADVALLRAGSDLDVTSDLPGLARFNHAIVLVRGTPQIWIDPTDEYTPAGELPSADQGRLALVANANTTDLMQTPFAGAADNRSAETRAFTLAEEGKASVVETTEATGTAESSMRRYAATTDQKSYREALETYAKSGYLAKALKSYDTTNPHDLATPFKLRIEVTEAQRGITTDGEAVVAVFPSELLEDLPYALKKADDKKDDSPKKHTKRQNDFVFKPFQKEWTYRIVPPPGYIPRELPQNETVKLGSTTVTQEFAAARDGIVSATFRFDSGKRRLTPSEFEETRKAIVEFLERPVVMLGFEQIGMTKLNAGDIAGALAEYRKLAALHPKEARHQVEIARAMLAGGMGEPARAQVKKAIALEPTYAGAQRALGTIMEHDLLGRPYRKGWDLAAARAAYKKAKELDPKDAGIRAEYAKLLELGDDGLVFGDHAPLGDAVTEYKALINDLQQPTYAGELLLALAHEGRFAEMKEIAKKTEDDTQRRIGVLVAIGATDGGAAAVKEANSYDQSARKSILREAAGILMSLRLYPAAATMLEAANTGSSTPELRAQLDAIRKAKRLEDMQLPIDDPKTVVKKSITAIVTTQLSGAEMANFFTSDFKSIFYKQDDDPEWNGPRRMLLRLARKQGVPLAFYADVGVNGAQYSQDGNEQIGYRIKTRGIGGVGNETYFVVREGSEYKLSASTRVPAMIGASVVRMLDANQLDAAKQWLNWARDEFGAGSGDDALDGLPFTALWEKATQNATAGAMRVAAASMMISADLADKGIPILEASRKAETSPERQLHIDHALAMALISKQKPDDVLPIAKRLHAAKPRSSEAFDMLYNAYQRLGKRAESEQLANERLKMIPKDQDALRALAENSMTAGDYATADRYYRQILQELEPSPVEYNEIAWNALLAGRDLEAALENARQALSSGGTGSPALLHTVAAIYAELGKSMEARDALLQSIDIAGREDPSPADWYVLGRIAENYGATDAALAAYRKVDKPKVADAGATYVLAARRMKALGVK